MAGRPAAPRLEKPLIAARREAVLRRARDARSTGPADDTPDDYASAMNDELFQALDNLEMG
ncbi:hypothetical protein [Streptomyces sp. NPDC054786]